MENLGAIAILMAFCLAVYAAIASAIGRARRKPFLIASGSIQRAGHEVHFVLTQANLKLNVAYTGSDPLPDTFRDGAQALADGKLGPDGVFRAGKIQAKCASKYEAKPGAYGPKPGAAPTSKSSI